MSAPPKSRHPDQALARGGISRVGGVMYSGDPSAPFHSARDDIVGGGAHDAPLRIAIASGRPGAVPYIYERTIVAKDPVGYNEKTHSTTYRFTERF